jgi:hypothetical protein
MSAIVDDGGNSGSALVMASLPLDLDRRREANAFYGDIDIAEVHRALWTKGCFDKKNIANETRIACHPWPDSNSSARQVDAEEHFN